MIRPAEPTKAEAPTERMVRDEKRFRDRLRDPQTAEFMDRLYQVAGMRKPVIDAPPPPKKQSTGPVIGY